MQAVESRLREAVRELLSSGQADVVVGYETASLPLRTRPCFVRSADDVGKLVWNPFCVNNLAVYLPRFFERPGDPRKEYAPPKVGIVAKSCDARSVAGLLRENQIPRENVTVIGVPCPGMADAARIEAQAGGAVSACEVKPDGGLEVVASGGKKSLKVDDVLADSCRECPHPAPEGADIAVEGESRSPAGEVYARVAEYPLLRLPAGLPQLLLQGLLHRPEQAELGGQGRRRPLGDHGLPDRAHVP
jgi:coenzyme F420-reducing hydrogenase beta subunit